MIIDKEQRTGKRGRYPQVRQASVMIVANLRLLIFLILIVVAASLLTAATLSLETVTSAHTAPPRLRPPDVPRSIFNHPSTTNRVRRHVNL